ncbi:MAG: replication-associated recombination protein A, partial [Thermoflavifilum sp.]|nr:replication-associated recombination protein A [Thermoflavifilum sp.]
MDSHPVPLAERMRPRHFDELVGQPHLTAPDSGLRQALRQQNLPSLIFWGPPGVGKTTIAQVIATQLGKPFYALSAISSGVKEVRTIIEKAEKQGGAVLFIDEIHRFNKAQQDALLGAVEKGVLTLIGATTENPSFEVNAALLSRCMVYVLYPLKDADLLEIAHRALRQDAWLSSLPIELGETAALLRLSGGDARRLLNLLELAVDSLLATQPAGQKLVITDELVMKVAQKQVALYDKQGEQHYDIISAFIKSIRGSDPNAAVYWLARMIAGGEDVQFIARRMVILAAEDIGNANPNALLLATSTFQAVSVIGYPEASLILSQCAIYLACSPKSNAAYEAIQQALDAVDQYGPLPVPLHLRNAPTGLMRKLHYGEGYQYAHHFTDHFVDQEYLPDPLKGKRFYTPGPNPREQELRKQLQHWWKEK